MQDTPRASVPSAVRRFPVAPLLALLALLALAVAGCYTEIGNPTKQNQVTATFTIDYADAPLPKVSAGPPGAAAVPESGRVSIEQFWFNVVEANYSTLEESDNRIWKLPDSLGVRVDFTGRDTRAALPQVSVPAGEWIFMKLESRIPVHDTLRADTLDFAAFADPGYIKGAYSSGGRQRRFLCQLPNVYRINLVYEQDLLESAKRGDAYDLEFTFYASRWMRDVDPFAADTLRDMSGQGVAVIDLEHNRDLYDRLTANFYKAFNSSGVWKEVRDP